MYEKEYKRLSYIIFDMMINLKTTFWGSFLTVLNRVISNEIPYAALLLNNKIDYTLYINPKLFKILKDDQLKSLLIHEVNHLLYDHINISKFIENKKLWNIATDLYINTEIIKQLGEKNSLPYANLSKKEYKNKINKLNNEYNNNLITTEEYKEKLYKYNLRGINYKDYNYTIDKILEKGSHTLYDELNKESQKNKNNDQFNGEKNLPKNKSEDKKSTKNEKSKILPNTDTSGSTSNDNDKNNNHNPNSKHNNKNNKNGELIYDHGHWNKISNLDKITKDLVKTQLKHKVKNIYENLNDKEIGNLPGNLRKKIDLLLEKKKPILNWRREFNKWARVNSTNLIAKKTRMKPNLFFPDQPVIIMKKSKNIAFCIDTSGSMKKDELIRAGQELLNIKRMIKCDVTVIELDSKIDLENGIYKLKSISQLKNRYEKGLIKGGGGTSMIPLIEYLNKNKKLFSSAFYFTDGYLNKPNKQSFVPLTMLITKNGKEISTLKKLGFKFKLIKINDNE